MDEMVCIGRVLQSFDALSRGGARRICNLAFLRQGAFYLVQRKKTIGNLASKSDPAIAIRTILHLYFSRASH
jgi:hypothetical protein